MLSQPEGWEPSALETDSTTLWDGTLVQVGKSTEPRSDLLARFRATLGIVTLTIVVIALSGGVVVTQSALLPIQKAHQGRQPYRSHRTHGRARAAFA